MKTSQHTLIQLLLILVLIAVTIKTQAQCTGTSITLINSSFEGIPSTGAAPSGWEACQSGQSPDIQPGNFKITLPPSNGLTYAGFYFLDTILHPNIGSWQEGLSQELPTPFINGMEYHSSVDLSNSTTTDASLEPGCAELEIWGGFSACDHSELLWSSGNINNYDSWKNFQVVFTPAANYTHITIQIKGLGCSGMPYILVDNFAPFIPEYRVHVNLSADNDTICPGNQVNLTAVADNGIGNYTYNWNTANAIGSQLTINPLQTSTISVIATDSNGCISAPSKLTLVVHSELKLNYVANPVCEGDSVTLHLYGTGGDHNYHFKLLPLNLTGKSITFKPEISGLYTVVMSDGCQAITDTLNLTINPAPVADFLVTKVSSSEFSFTDMSAIKSGNITNWNWSMGDHTTSTEINPLHDYSQAGSYEVELQVQSDAGCKSMPKSLNVHTSQLTLNYQTANIQAEILPVTASIDDSNTAENESFDIEIYSLTGVQMAKILNAEKNVFRAIHSISLPAGTFIYKATSGKNKPVTGKVIITR